MEKFKFDAMLEEFPFLAQLLPAPDYYCQNIQVKRVDEMLLAYTPRANYAQGAGVGIQDVETVSFVTSDGVIENAVQQEIDVVDHAAYTDNTHTCSETILAAIDRLGVAEKLTHIVMVNSGYYVEEHYSTRDYMVKIYKAPRDTTITAAVAAAKAKARTMVLAEVDF